MGQGNKTGIGAGSIGSSLIGGSAEVSKMAGGA